MYLYFKKNKIRLHKDYQFISILLFYPFDLKESSFLLLLIHINTHDRMEINL